MRQTLRAQTRITTGIFRDMALTRPLLIEGRADGELTGTQFGTHVRYDRIVEVTKPWMRVIARSRGRSLCGTTTRSWTGAARTWSAGWRGQPHPRGKHRGENAVA